MADFLLSEAIDEDGIDEGNIDFDESLRESDEDFIDDGEMRV